MPLNANSIRFIHELSKSPLVCVFICTRAGSLVIYLTLFSYWRCNGIKQPKRCVSVLRNYKFIHICELKKIHHSKRVTYCGGENSMKSPTGSDLRA